MARAKQASMRKRSRSTLPVWGAAGMSLAMAGGASAAVLDGEQATPQKTLPMITLGEEELSDVTLSKFFVYDREATNSSKLGVQFAQRCGRCGGCAGRGCGGRCGGCAGREGGARRSGQTRDDVTRGGTPQTWADPPACRTCGHDAPIAAGCQEPPHREAQPQR